MDLSRLSSQPWSRAAASSRHRLLADSIEKPGYVVENKGVSKTTGRLWPNVAQAETPVMDIAAVALPKVKSPRTEVQKTQQTKTRVVVRPRIRLHTGQGHQTARSATARLVGQNRSSVRIMDVARPGSFVNKPTVTAVSTGVKRPLLTSNPGYIANKTPQLVCSQSIIHTNRSQDIPKVFQKEQTIAPIVSTAATKEVTHLASVTGVANQKVPQLVSKYKQPVVLDVLKERSIDGISITRQQVNSLSSVEPVRGSSQPLRVQLCPRARLNQAANLSSGSIDFPSDNQSTVNEESRQFIEKTLATQHVPIKSHLHIEPHQLILLGIAIILLGVNSLFPNEPYGQWFVIVFGFIALILRLSSRYLYSGVLMMFSFMSILALIKSKELAESYAVYVLLLLTFGGIRSMFELYYQPREYFGQI